MALASFDFASLYPNVQRSYSFEHMRRSIRKYKIDKIFRSQV